MVKRVFAIIGVVVGVVGVFVGGVFGVMALMGKFKTPDVYPASLYFEEIVEPVVPDLTDPDKLYSIKLLATSDNANHDINHKSCLLEFKAGSNLITLWDKNNNIPLAGSTQKGYWVNCNEEIYYKINKLADVQNAESIKGDNRGKVVLSARTENNHQKTQTPLTFWIDRQVTSIKLNHANSDYTNEPNKVPTQTITIGVEDKLYLTTDGFVDSAKNQYMVFEPVLSEKPIGNLNKKLVEVYLNKDAMNLGVHVPGTDHSPLLTQDLIENTYYANFIGYDQDKQAFYLKPELNKEYHFIIAVFPTYQAKIDFETEFPDANSTERLKAMVKRELKVVAESTIIKDVEFGIESVDFFLYEEGSVTLNAQLTGGNNLGLSMYDAGNNLTSIRMSGVELGTISASKLASLADIVEFEAEDGEKLKTTEITKSNIQYVTGLDRYCGYKIIDYIGQGGKEYRAKHGVALFDGTNGYKLLPTGSYLDFYEYNDFIGAYAINNGFADIEMFAGHENEADNKSWSVLPKSIPNDTFMVAIVVNADGSLCWQSVPVSVEAKNLDFDITPILSSKLDVTIDNATTTYETLQFSDIITNVTGSYTALAFVVSATDANYIDCISVYDNSVPIYVVGYIEDGKFVNNIRFKDIIEKTHEITLTLCQFNNDFGDDISEFIKDNSTNVNGKYVKINSTNYTISQNLIVKNIQVSNDPVLNLYEGTVNNVLLLKSDQLLLLEKFYGVNLLLSYLETNNSNFIIKGLEVDSGQGLKVTYDVDLPATNVSIFTKEDSPLGKIELCKGIEIKSAAPDKIVLTYVDKTSNKVTIDLKSQLGDAISLDIKVTFNGSDYEYELYHNGNPLNNESFFNINKLASGSTGFYGEYGVSVPTALIDTHTFSYTSVGNSVAAMSWDTKVGNYYIIEVNKITAKEFYVEVSIKGTKGYLKFNITSDIDFASTLTDKEIKNNTFELGDYATFYEMVESPAGNPNGLGYYEYNGSKYVLTADTTVMAGKDYYKDAGIIPGYEFVDFSNLRITKIAGVNKTNDDYTSEWIDASKQFEFKDKTGIQIFTITHDYTKGWEFKKGTNYEFQNVELELDLITKFRDIQHITFSWTNDTTFAKNVLWKDTIYQGTTVLVWEIGGSDNPLVKITSDSTGVVTSDNVFIFSDSNPTGTNTNDNGTFVFNELGQNIVRISAGGINHDYVFNVVPNVILTQQSDIELESETDYNISSLYSEIKSYPTGQQYNKPYDLYVDSSESAWFATTSSLTNKYKLLIDEKELALSIPTGAIDGFTTAELKELAKTEDKTIVLKYEETEVDEISVKLSNKYKIEYQTSFGTKVGEEDLDKDGTIDVENYHATLMANTVYNIGDLFSVFPTAADGYQLAEVEIGGVSVDVTVNSNTFTIGNLSNKYNNKLITFVFERFEDIDEANYDEDSYAKYYIKRAGETEYVPNTEKDFDDTATYAIRHTLKYSSNRPDDSSPSIEYTFDVQPYMPNLIYSLGVILSDHEYDLMTAYDFVGEIYDATLKPYGKIKAVAVKQITCLGTTTQINGLKDVEGNGFMFSRNVNAWNVKFSDFLGDTKDFDVTYIIEYVDGVVYEHFVTLTVQNRQFVQLEYPMGTIDFKVPTDTLTVDAKYVSEVALPVGEIAYEPIIVNGTTKKVIDFSSNADYTKTLRAYVQDRSGVAYTGDITIKVEKVAYTGSVGFKDVVFDEIVIEGSKVTFPLITNRSGYVTFRISSHSKNYAYYTVFLYATPNDKLSEANILHVTYNNNDNSEIEFVNEMLTYKNADKSDFFDTAVFKTMFDVEYSTVINNLKLYIIDSYTLKAGGYNHQGVGIDDGVNPINKELRNVCVNNLKVEPSSMYQTIECLAVYNAGNVYCFGTIIFHITPDSFETAVHGSGTYDIKYTIAGHQIGEHTQRLKADTHGPLSCPLSFGPGFDSISFEGNKPGFVEVSGTTLNFVSYTAEETTFVVYYTHGSTGFTAKVTYTYEATIVPDNLSEIETGKFNTGSETFDSSITIDSSILGSYTGRISLDGTNEIGTGGTYNSINYTYDSSTGKLTFTQDTNEHIFDLIITCLDLDKSDGSKATITQPIRLRQGLYIRNETSIGNRMESGFTTPDYTSSTGSSIAIAYDDGSSGTAPHYTIGTGVTIYTSAASYLKLVVDDADVKYVLASEDATLSKARSNIITYDKTAATTLALIHMAETRAVNLTMQVSMGVDLSSSEAFTFDNSTLYITIAKTYKNIVPIYAQEGADHENVVKGSKITGTDYSDLMSKWFNNTPRNRFVVENLDGVYLRDNNGVGPDHHVDFVEMGFMDADNANYIDYEAAVQSLDVLKTTQSDGYYFANGNNVLATMSVGNSAGVSGVDYNYQIMSSLDGIDFGTTSGYNGSGYLSYTVLKDDSNMSYTNFETIGTLADTRNGNVFTLPSMTFVTPGTYEITGWDRPLIQDNVSAVTDLSSWTCLHADSIMSLYRTGIVGSEQYYLIKNGEYVSNFTVFEIVATNKSDLTDVYNIYVVYNDEDHTVYIALSPKASMPSYVKLRFTMTGATADIATIDVMFFNYSVYEPYGDENSIDETILAGNVITLKEKIREDEDSTLNTDLHFKPLSDGSSFYTYSNGSQTQTVPITTDGVSGLFTYESDATVTDCKTKIRTQQIGQAVTLCLAYQIVTDDGTVVTEAVYWFRIQSNYLFGANSVAPTGANQFETYFDLSKAVYEGGDKLTSVTKFPLKIDFLEVEANHTGWNLENGENGKLAYALYNKAGEKFDNSHSRVTITIKSMEGVSKDYFSDFIIVSKDSIEFIQDYFGDITLQLAVNTQFGSFVSDWIIHVKGILNLEYVLSDPNGSALENGNTAFNSGSSHNIVNSGEIVGVGINLVELAKCYDNTTTPAGYVDMPVLIDYGYVIVPEDSGNGLDAETEYKNGTKISGSGNLSSARTFEIKLPVVPVSSTGSEVNYFVIYKLQFKYMEDEKYGDKNVYYVTYLVKNTVNTTKTNAVISADLTNKDLTQVSGIGAYLGLFNYEERIAWEGKNIIVTFNGTNYSMAGMEGSAIISSDGKVFGSYTIDREAGTIQKSGEDAKPITSRQGISNSTTLFATPFDSVIDYANYIKGISHITFEGKTTHNYKLLPMGAQTRYLETTDRTPDKDKTYYTAKDSSPAVTGQSLITAGTGFIDGNTYYEQYTSSSVLGIDFTQAKQADLSTLETSNLFENEMVDKLLVKGTEDTTLDYIEKWSTSNTNGFKITTSNAITPKSDTILKVSRVFETTDDYEFIAIFDNDSTPTEEILESWVSGADITSSGTEINANPVATYYLKNYDGADVEYKLYVVTYKGNDGTWYGISKPLYALGSSTGDLVYINYRGLSGDDFVTVSYEEGNKSSLSTENVVMWYKTDMNMGSSTEGKIVPEKSGITIEHTPVGGTDTDISEISMTFEQLVTYKNYHPEAYAMVKEYKIEASGQARKLVVHFVLPEKRTLIVERMGTYTKEFSDIGTLPAYQESGVPVTYNFKMPNGTTITGFEGDSNYVSYDFDNNKLKVSDDADDGNNITKYFEANPLKTQLKLNCKFIVEKDDDRYEVEFDIIIFQ